VGGAQKRQPSQDGDGGDGSHDSIGRQPSRQPGGPAERHATPSRPAVAGAPPINDEATTTLTPEEAPPAGRPGCVALPRVLYVQRPCSG
jgi:hypothetical protein